MNDRLAEGAHEEPLRGAERELTVALVALHDLISDCMAAGGTTPEEAARCADALALVAAAAEQAQHLGLADIAMRLAEHVATARNDFRQPLLKFVIAAADYVNDPVSREAQTALLACATGDGMPAMGADELAILRLMVGMTPEAEQEPVALPSEPVQVEVAVLQALRQEAGPLLDQVIRGVAGLEGVASEERIERLFALASELESLARGAGFSGLHGLATVLEATSAEVAAGGMGVDAIAGLACSVLAYLESPDDAARSMQLAALIPDPDTAALARALASVVLVEGAPAKPPRATTASAEDVSLELPADINPELLDGLLVELPVQTATFAQAVQRIVAGSATHDDLMVAKRAAHTLKGAANTVGVRGIAALTHALEDILLALAEEGVLPNLGLAQTLSYASDCLEAMGEALTGTGAPPDDAINVLQDVLNWANRIDERGIDVARGAEAAEGAGQRSETTASVAGREPAATLRVPASLVDELLRLVGETMTSTVQIQNRITQAMAQAKVINRQNLLLQQLVAELETLVDLRGLGAPGRSIAAAVGAEFDALEFEEYNELHTLSRRLAEVATDAREMGLVAEEHLAQLAELQEAQARLQVENQKTVMSTRMVPVSSVFARLQRGVRQACRILDKQVELVLLGETTVMDGNVLQELIEALMHLLRNAVDHGIEPGAERIAVGKPENGRIELEFRRDGDYIAVRCSDDGQGLDLAAVRATAEEKGLIDVSTVLSPEETARLILIPGISTRERATQVSGRGIGMDVVNSKILELKGSLHLASQRGAGLTVELKLPVTLLSTNALLVRIRHRVVALSTRGIEEIHYVAADEVAGVAEALRPLVNEPFEMAELESVLDFPGDRRTKGRRGWPVLLVRLVSGGLRAVVVQEVLENRNVVVKPLGPYVPRVPGTIGATILGDGNVAPVIDLPDRLYTPAHVLPRAPQRDAAIQESVAAERLRVLVVDDSISARRALVQVVRDSGYDVRAAADGLEAIAILEQRVPDLIITDMEMPRMSGFELAQHVRAGEGTRRVPVIMVTSRSTAKHRRQAELAGVNVYLTKPFDDRELLGHVETLTRREG